MQLACRRGIDRLKSGLVRAFVVKTVAVLVVLQLLGGHWALLQTTAWISMVVSYSRDASVSVAVEKTFSGEHPCVLCVAVKEGKNQQRKQEAVNTVVKMEAVLVAVASAPPRRVVEFNHAEFDAALTERNIAPPTPPPLLA